MKYTFLSLVGLLALLTQTAFASPRFLALEANSSAPYPNGQSAVLTAHVRIQPTNPNDEIFLRSSLTSPSEGKDLKITRISDDEALAVTPALNEAGSYVWHVTAYLQDKAKAREIETAIATTEDDNLRIERALQVETDPVIRDALTAQRNRNNDFIGRSRSQLWNDRRQLESQDLTFTALPAPALTPRLENPVISIEADHANAVYETDSRAVFYVHALTDFEGPDGIQEILAFADIAGNGTNPGLPVERKRLGDRDFAFTSPVFAAADVGSRRLGAYLKIRSKAQADSIRGSRAKAIERRAGFIALRDGATDPQTRSYYASLIHEMDMTISELNRQLEAMLVSVGGSRDFYFDVVAAPVR